MFNPWKHLRVAGNLLMIAAAFVKAPMCWSLLLLGFVFLGIGIQNGLLAVERRLETLEQEVHGASETEA